MVSINIDDDRDDVRRTIGASVDRESLRTGDARRKRLQAGSQRRTREWGLSVEIDEDHQTAHVETDPDTGYKIVISGREFAQPVTDLDDAEWDYTVQRALDWHEDGHVLYSALDDKDDYMDNYDSGEKGVAHTIWNTLEDAAIEHQIAQRWSNAYPLLRALRANLYADVEPGIEDIEQGGKLFTVAHAVQAVLNDRWSKEVYSIDRGVESALMDADDDEYHFARDGDRDIFVDGIYPLIGPVVDDVLTEPDGAERNRIIFEFVDEVMPYIDNSTADGKSQMNRDGDATEDGMPDDSRNNHSGDAKSDARDIDIDPDDIEKVVIGQDVPEDAEPVGDVELPDDVEVEVADDVANDRAQEAGASSEVLDEIEQIQNALDQPDNDELQTDEIVLPTERQMADEARYEWAKARSQPIARLLQNRLQQETVSKTKRHQRRGRFTGRGGSTVRAAQGEKRVKERVVEPEEKDYHFAFVLDRSTSMRGTPVTEAEKALGVLAIALEDVGVETMIVELYNNEARLAKPFGQPIQQAKDRLFHGDVSGGTPLGGAVELSRERLRTSGDHTAMVVVTDGEPTDGGHFEEAVDLCTMPTIGVNISKDDDIAAMDRYDRAMKAAPGEDLQSGLMALVNEVLF